jgi:hypothetical protein
MIHNRGYKSTFKYSKAGVKNKTTRVKEGSFATERKKNERLMMMAFKKWAESNKKKRAVCKSERERK